MGQPNGESVLGTASATSLLVEFIGVAALPVADWTCEGELHVEFQKTMVDFEHGY